MPVTPGGATGVYVQVNVTVPSVRQVATRFIPITWKLAIPVSLDEQTVCVLFAGMTRELPSL